MSPLRRRVDEGDPLLQVRPGGGVVPRQNKVAPSVSWASRRCVGSAACWANRHELFPNSRAVGNAPRLR